MRSRIQLLRIIFACLLLTGMVYAQGVGASGEIRGTVTDPSGAVVGNASVTATDIDKGIKHTVASDGNGQFHLAALPPARYSVSVSKSGFQSEVAKNVVVNVGQTSTVDFPMKVSQVSEQVEVTAEPPVVETERGAQANVINEEAIRELPINRRDYLTFTLLAPAVSDSTRLSGDQDFRVKQTPQSGLSFYGSNGRGNSVTVDGGEANDDAGGVRLNISQDGVQEFQINRSNYGAELGGASGATINIVTKSGTNDVHGTLFSYFRNDALDAANPFSVTQALAPGQTFNPALPDTQGVHTKDSLTREQFGGSIGFPLKKDKTFLYSSFEGLVGDAQNAVPLLTNTNIFRPQGAGTGNDQVSILQGLVAEGATSVPCITNGGGALPPTFLPAATCAGVLQSLLTIDPNANLVPILGPVQGPLQTARNAYVVNQFENNGGLFPYDNRLYLASTRFDHQFSDRNQVTLRYSFGHDLEQNPDVQSLTGFSRGSDVKAFDNTILASWFHQFSGRTLNDAHVQWNYSNFDVIPNSPGQVGLDIPGFGNLGTQIFLPSLTIMRRYEFADNVTLIRGKHTFKFGGSELYRGNHSESHTFFPGRFVFGNLPGGLLTPCFVAATGAANPCGLASPGAGINSIQSVELGLPQFYQQGFGNPVYDYPRPYTSAFVQDQWQVSPSLTFNIGVRYELDSQFGPINTDKNNFAPRASIAWDPFKDHKTVVRAGYGIFYSPIYGQIDDVVQTLGLVNGIRPIAQTFVPLTASPVSSATIFQTLFAQGVVQCSTPAAGNAACITPANLTQFGINITNSGPVPPGSVLFSAQPGYRNPYSQQAELGIEHEIAKGWAVSLSGIYVHTIGLPTAIDTNPNTLAPFVSVPLANGSTATFRSWAATATGPCSGTPNPCFNNPLLLQNNVYSSVGSSLYEGGILEVKKRFSSHFSVMANYTYSKAFDDSTDYNSDFGPVDNTNLAGERSLSNFDQRHKVVFATIADTGNFGGRIFSGFQLAPIFRYNSGHPFDLLAGADVNGDNHSTNDRPIGAARNTGEGPDFMSFDMRISRRFKMGEKANLQLLAEGFNLFNRTNFASVNNVVGPNFGLPVALGGTGATTFNVSGSSALSPSTPLGFTSAFPMRQLQLGVRIGF